MNRSCFISALLVLVWVAAAYVTEAQLRVEVSNDPPADVDLRVMGAATGENYQIEFADDLLPHLWDPLVTFRTSTGDFDHTDQPPTDVRQRLYRARRLPLPQQVEYTGATLTLTFQGFRPLSQVAFDVDGDGIDNTIVTVDEGGLLTASLDLSILGGSSVIHYRVYASGTPVTPSLNLRVVRTGPGGPSREVPVNSLPISTPVMEPGISASAGSRFGVDYTRTFTPSVHGVELVSGKVRHQFPITSFPGRLIDFAFKLHHASLVDYNGPVGLSMSHTFNMMIVRRSTSAGRLITPDLRIFDISSTDGVHWTLPAGFDSRLTLDEARQRWSLTHYAGQRCEFFLGLNDQPGLMTALSEPNGNQLRFFYDGAGRLQRIRTTLGQEQVLTYHSDGRLSGFSDRLGRTWTFAYNGSRALERIQSPSTDYLDVAPNALITEADLSSLQRVGTRDTVLTYDFAYPGQLAYITDPRGAIPSYISYDAIGRVVTATINGSAATFNYAPAANPEPLAVLDAGNVITRTIDRDGNVRDYEMHDDSGGPNAAGRGGLRRMIQWTESGRGGAALRAREPAWWETRRFFDNDDLKPAAAAQPFSNKQLGVLVFGAHDIPSNGPRSEFTYNANRQVLAELYTDGTDSIRTAFIYQPASYGESNQYSRLLTATDPRGFDSSPLYIGLSFETSYHYDAAGNLVRRDAPAVTRGVETGPQIISERWVYNPFGQVTRYTDGNGNVSTWEYYEGGPSAGGDLNTAGTFPGYLHIFIVGVEPSSNTSVNAVTVFKVNALGQVTERTDPEGHIYRYEYNDLAERVRVLPPQVTLFNDSPAQYETEYYYDAAGNQVMARRKILQVDGIVGPKTWTSLTRGYDAVNNVTAVRAQVDTNPGNDQIQVFAYDGNEQLIVQEQPEKNRTFYTYDERGLLLRRFFGVAGVGGTSVFYPPSDADTSLDPGANEVGVETYTYDARGNLVEFEDGRGNTTLQFYDFANRFVSRSDPNGNGFVREVDDAGLVLTEDRGSVSRTTGLLGTPQSRTYFRYDEVGRMYQQVQDITLSSTENLMIDPQAGVNSSYTRGYDLAHRMVRATNARGYVTRYSYDAANRLVSVTDAIGNQRFMEYDRNANPTRLTEVEFSKGGPSVEERSYVMTYQYDALNRLVETHRRGEDGSAIDHVFSIAYDSRDNPVLVTDAEGNVEFSTYDLLNRRNVQQRFDGNPLTGSPEELRHWSWDYDGNDRVAQVRVRSNVAAPGSEQVTRYGYDNLNRRVRTVFPDSDDPVSGIGSGADGQYDRVDVVFDATSNPTQVTDQRGVVFDNTFDPGNRLTSRSITRPPNVFGESFKAVSYDHLDRATLIANDYAQCAFTYDAYSRLRSETQSIRLDGTGATSGYEQPIVVELGYNPNSVLTRRTVLDGSVTNLEVTIVRDELERPDRILASYFGAASHDVCGFTWFGPDRAVRRTLGNGAKLDIAYDAKRRPASHVWTPEHSDEVLVGFEYGYNDMDRALFERFLHDGNRYDHVRYNSRYEVEGVEYRSSSAIPPSLFSNQFAYEDSGNRVSASFADPFGLPTVTTDLYTANEANEYTTLTRTTVPSAASPDYDRAGNPITYTLRAPEDSTSETDGNVFTTWDPYSRLQSINFPASGNAPQGYLYDPLDRRIVVVEAGPRSVPDRRFIWSGRHLVAERLFDGGSFSNAPSTLERIYVPGLGPDDDILCAIDGNADGVLGTPAQKNTAAPGADQEFYYLGNRMGAVMGLLDADNDQRVMEYYRYQAFGNPLVMPIADADSNGLEDTPLDLTDNVAGARRGISPYKNFKFRVYWDTATGLYYLRDRHYDPTTGRYLNRDRPGYGSGLNAYLLEPNDGCNPEEYTVSKSVNWSTSDSPVQTDDLVRMNARFPGDREGNTRSGVIARPAGMYRLYYPLARGQNDDTKLKSKLELKAWGDPHIGESTWAFGRAWPSTWSGPSRKSDSGKGYNEFILDDTLAKEPIPLPTATDDGNVSGTDFLFWQRSHAAVVTTLSEEFTLFSERGTPDARTDTIIRLDYDQLELAAQGF